MADHEKTAALILGGEPPSEDDKDKDMALHQAMEDFARAVHQTPPDLRGMQSAFRAGFDILDCEDDKDDEKEGGDE